MKNKLNASSDSESDTQSSEESESEMECMKKQLYAKDKEITKLKQEIKNLKGKLTVFMLKYLFQYVHQITFACALSEASEMKTQNFNVVIFSIEYLQKHLLWLKIY